MLPDRLSLGKHALDCNSGDVPATRGRGPGVFILGALVVIMMATNVLTLVDSRFHAKAYAFIETAARAVGMENYLSNSPTETNRRFVEIAARQSAEAATRLQKATTVALIANSLVLVDATRTLAQEHKMLRQTHQALTDTSKVVARRVAVRTAAGATRSVTTLAGKALPYLGAASILTLTALDIADACQTLKDANELAIAAGTVKGGEEGTICSMQVPSIDQVRTWAGGLWH